MEYSPLVDFFRRKPFPKHARLLGLEATVKASVGDLRSNLLHMHRETGCSLVAAFGLSYHVKAEIDPPSGLYEMPTFEFDGANLAFRSQDVLVVLLGDEPITWPHEEIAAPIADGWTLRFVGSGARLANKRNDVDFIDGLSNMSRPAELSAFRRAVLRPDGSSMIAYRRIELDVDRWNEFSVSAQEAIIGRRKEDGGPLGDVGDYGHPSYRYDPAGTRTPFTSHTRKSYPRRRFDPITAEPDWRHRIFRWGYSDTDTPGLHFLCLQADLKTGFEHVYGRWMCSQHTPAYGAGPDALLTSGVMRTRGGGYFYLPANAVLVKGHSERAWLSEYA